MVNEYREWAPRATESLARLRKEGIERFLIAMAKYREQEAMQLALKE